MPPPKTTVELLAVKFDPVPFHAVVVEELSLSVLVSPFKVPAVSVTSPVNVCVLLVPRSSVPPDPLIVRAAALTLPPNVAVPAVLVMLTLPVVVNPAILWVAIVLAIMIGEALAVNVPLLTKLPPKVN